MTTKTVIGLYKAKDGYRWRMVDAKNGLKIGAATQGYSRKIDAVKNLNRVGHARALCNDAELLEVGVVTV